MVNIIFYRLLLEYGASVLRVVDGRTIQVNKISLSKSNLHWYECSASVQRKIFSSTITPQEIMKEKMPNLDPNTVAVKAKPKENSEQVH